jgi:hypothetical protein
MYTLYLVFSCNGGLGTLWHESFCQGHKLRMCLSFEVSPLGLYPPSRTHTLATVVAAIFLSLPLSVYIYIHIIPVNSAVYTCSVVLLYRSFATMVLCTGTLQSIKICKCGLWPHNSPVFDTSSQLTGMKGFMVISKGQKCSWFLKAQNPPHP